MNGKTLLWSCILIAALAACAGCTILSPPPEPTPVPTPVPTTVPTTEATTVPTPTPTPTRSTEPGPTQELPPQWPLSISVEKAGTYSMTVITHFDGGKGMASVLRLDATLTTPEGIVITKSIDKPKMGDIIEIEGTKGTDRIEVSVVMNSGDTYTVIDQKMPYKTRN